MCEMNLIKAYFIGLTIALTVGPITLLIVQRGLTKGLKSAVVTSLGVALADFTFALIASSIGASVLLFVSTYEWQVHLFSGVVLLGLAAYIAYSAVRTYKQHIHAHVAKVKGGDFVSAYVLTMHNPMTIAVFLGFVGYMTDIQSFGGVLLFALMLFLGSYTGQLFFGLTSFSLRKFFQNPKAILLLNCISALGIAIFSFLQLLS